MSAAGLGGSLWGAAVVGMLLVLVVVAVRRAARAGAGRGTVVALVLVVAGVLGGVAVLVATSS